MTEEAAPAERLHVELRGAVQGVGFRPYVYRLATELGLTGWVSNSNGGLRIEVEGAREELDRFLERVHAEKPAAAVVLEWNSRQLAPAGSTSFEIITSESSSLRTAGVQADLATCPKCLAELLDPANRRYGYPFTNCTNCGPRYTIVSDIPYDRSRTTMRDFPMCERCRREYADRLDRRFHAQPNACPVCGPRLLEASIQEAAAAIQRGRIVALQGIGGFQLLADARNADAVGTLRTRKHREEKPFAMMIPSVDLIDRYCFVSAEEERALTSAAAPIVLLRPRAGGEIAPNVAGNSAYWGVMLPYSPLHHELMRHFPAPVVATSGNRSDEPIVIDATEAHERLGGIADLFVSHNRPIERPCDDSVVRVTGGRPCVIRRARGYAPLPVAVHREAGRVLAVGGHTKNTVAIGMGSQVILSQHIGDLDTVEARGAFERAIGDLLRLYRFEPEAVVCDLHPDYASTRWALASGLPVVQVQHHHAHVAACAADNTLDGPYLGVAWDGTGLGLDGTIWGGEFFAVTPDGMERIASLRPFRLQGGEAGARDCWRSAASLVAATFGDVDLPQLPVPSNVSRTLLEGVLNRGVNAPVTTSVGRLFDAVASLTGVAQYNHFEGQAAMALEAEIGSVVTRAAYPLPDGDWEALLIALVEDLRKSVPRPLIAAKFHNALVDWMGEVASRAGIAHVVLSGGVFQNGYLVERASELLESRGFHVHTHHQVPANDGGIALGQAVLGGCR